MQQVEYSARFARNDFVKLKSFQWSWHAFVNCFCPQSPSRPPRGPEWPEAIGLLRRKMKPPAQGRNSTKNNMKFNRKNLMRAPKVAQRDQDP